MRRKYKMYWEVSVSVGNLECGRKYRYASVIQNVVGNIGMRRKYEIW